MVTSKQCLEKYGEPGNPAISKPSTLTSEELRAISWMGMYDVPPALEIGVIPKKIWCNKDLVYPLSQALINLVSQGYAESELLTWDGCFNVRRMKGSKSMSLHSWGIAIDVNAFNNQFGKVPALSSGFVECFTSVGFDWGGNWRYQDGMHFQLSNI